MNKIIQQSLLHIFPFLIWKKEVNNQTIKADLLAGLTNAIIVLPQGVAFAMIAGLPPIMGLYTAMVTPIIAGLFGSSKHLISGPTTPISLIVFASISKFAEPTTEAFIQLTLVLTFIAGLIQLLMGIGRLGTLVNFVSHTVVVGFTAGAAALIITSQLKNFFGIQIPASASFTESWLFTLQQIFTANWWVVGVALVTLMVAILSKKFFPRLPHLLIAMVLGSILAVVIGGETVGIKFIGALPSALPIPYIPELSFGNIQKMVPNAVAVALLGLIEAVAIARSIALKSRQKLDGNQEFIGQGLSNIVGSIFGGYAGSGSFTRSGINYAAGAKTPMSGIFASLFLMLIVLFIAPLAAYLAMPVMAGLIILVGWSLIDFEHIKHIGKSSKRDNIILIATFLSTLFLDLEFAIYIGVILSLFFFLKGTSQPHIATMAPDPEHPRRPFTYILRKPSLKECPNLKIIRIDGSLFFGSTEHISVFFEKMRSQSQARYALILAYGINRIDLDGAEWLEEEAKIWKERGGGLYIASLKLIAQDVLRDSGIYHEIGEDHFFSSKTDAVKAIYSKMDSALCRACKAKVFKECEEKSTFNF